MVNFTQTVVAAACATVLVGAGWSTVGHAADPSLAPTELTSAIETIETAANAQDIDAVMAVYSNDFQGPDGFSYDQYAATLSEFWQQYSTLTYAVELLSWERDGSGLVAETLTTVSGTKAGVGQTMDLMAEVRSRQRYENGQVVSQEILSEQSRLAAGPMPPTVRVNLPAAVSPGQRFNYDAIVEEPLGDRLLLGLALDEGVTATDFLAPRPVDLQALAAGGLFKIGKAPDQPDQRWISSVLVREDGIVIDTRRMQVDN